MKKEPLRKLKKFTTEYKKGFSFPMLTEAGSVIPVNTRSIAMTGLKIKRRRFYDKFESPTKRISKFPVWNCLCDLSARLRKDRNHDPSDKRACGKTWCLS
jgi:hypothetical protein